MSGNASPSCGGHKAEMGDADVPVIDRSCPLDEAPDAIRYLAGGLRHGKGRCHCDVLTRGGRRQPRATLARAAHRTYEAAR
jgi:hypothetical protein